MTAPDPRVTLTEAEIDLLRGAWGAGGSLIWPSLHRRVERIIAARLATIRALADEWERGLRVPQVALDAVWMLREALGDPVMAQEGDGGTGSHGDAERAGEGDLCAGDCGRPVDRTIPNPIPEGFELMWSESMSGRALYCQACFDKPEPEDADDE